MFKKIINKKSSLLGVKCIEALLFFSVLFFILLIIGSVLILCNTKVTKLFKKLITFDMLSFLVILDLRKRTTTTFGVLSCLIE